MGRGDENTHKHAHTFSHTPCCLGSDFNDLHHKISVTDLSERSKDGKHTHTHTHAETHMLTRPHTFYKLANMESITHRSRSQRGGSRPDTLPPWRAPVRLTVIYTHRPLVCTHTCTDPFLRSTVVPGALGLSFIMMDEKLIKEK